MSNFFNPFKVVKKIIFYRQRNNKIVLYISIKYHFNSQMNMIYYSTIILLSYN